MKLQKRNKILPATKNSDFIESLFFEKKLKLFFQLIIVCLAFLIYANSLQNGFVLDDQAVITQNNFVKEGINGIPDIITTHYWAGFWTTNVGHYRPVSLILFSVIYEFFGQNAFAFHLVNVFLYIVLCFFLFKLLLKIFPKQPVLFSFITILIFITHPIHTEVVANIKSVDEILAFLFVVCAANSLLESFKNNSNLRLVASGIFFFLALMSKESSVTFLAAFPLIIFINQEAKVKPSVYLKMLVPVFVAILVYFIVRAGVLGIDFSGKTFSRTENSLFDADSFQLRSASVIFIMSKYVALLFWPFKLSFDYSYNQIPVVNWYNVRVIVTFLLLLLSFFYAIKNILKKNCIAFGILFFFITISIASNAVVLSGTTLGERLLFAPSLGFCIILSFFIVKLSKASIQSHTIKSFLKINILPLCLSFILILIYSFAVIARNTDWKSNYSLFKKDVETAPNSWKTHYCYGSELLQQYNTKNSTEFKKNITLLEAINHLKISISIDSSNYLAFSQLGFAYYLNNEFPNAIYYLKKYTYAFPDDKLAAENLGYAFARNMQYEEAIKLFAGLIANKYESFDIYLFKGLSEMELKKYSDAIESLNKAKSYNPENAYVLTNLATAFIFIENYQEAINIYQKLRNIKPENSFAFQQLTKLYELTGKKAY